MSSDYFYDKTIKNKDFTVEIFEKGDYECCTFVGCVFSNTNLSNIKFIDAEFVDCDLSNAVITKTSFQDVKFKNCKLLGLRFDSSSNFGFAAIFESCRLNDSSFYNMKLARCEFNECILHDVDFTQADLKLVQFCKSDLLNAIFDRSNLEKSDFRGSINYYLDPENNRLKGAKFSMPEVVGLLAKYKIVIN